MLVAERWIVAALRHRRFYALAELNEAIAELLEKLNQRPSRKRAGCRASLFAEVDRPALQPLPSERYVLAHWKTVRASIDYHVEVDRHYYSVPYHLAGEKLEARFTTAAVEILHRGKRVASHARSHVAYRRTTISEHMPKSHQAHLEWTPSRLIHWAEGIGMATSAVNSVLIIDEPELSLNIKWQRLLLSALLDIVSGGGVQFVFATHSIDLIGEHLNHMLKLEQLGPHQNVSVERESAPANN